MTIVMELAARRLNILLGVPAPVRHRGVPDAEHPAGPPTGRGLAGEALALLQVARLTRAAPWLALTPRGRGQRVIDVPGWKAPEVSMAPMRLFLRALGYDARSWGLGVNQGDPERDCELLAGRVEAASRDDGPVALVGWSLGGVIAREVARMLPERISTVVTYGTPVVGGPTHTLGASEYGAEECRRIEALAAQRDADTPIEAPMTAIYTRRDGVVDWRACIDRQSPNVRHVEVRSTHLGLGVDPDVWSTVARALHASA